MNKQAIITFLSKRQVQLSGVALISATGGALSGYFFAKNRLKLHYEEIANAEILEAKEFYRQVYKGEGYETPEDALTTLHGEEAAKALREYQGITDVEVEAPAKTEAELKEEEPEELESIRSNVFSKKGPHQDLTWDQEAEQKIRDADPDKPYIITYDEFFENDKGYDQVNLTYYENDDTLVDEQDVPVEDVDATVGEGNLFEFGRGSRDKNILYIQNDPREVNFEIVRSFGGFAQEVLGFDPDEATSIRHSERQGVRKFRNFDD